MEVHRDSELFQASENGISPRESRGKEESNQVGHHRTYASVPGQYARVHPMLIYCCGWLRYMLKSVIVAHPQVSLSNISWSSVPVNTVMWFVCLIVWWFVRWFAGLFGSLLVWEMLCCMLRSMIVARPQVSL